VASSFNDTPKAMPVKELFNTAKPYVPCEEFLSPEHSSADALNNNQKQVKKVKEVTNLVEKYNQLKKIRP
jgi:hypothetical protein